METYLLVSAQFLTTGGQDRANYALAAHLARRGDEVHLVAHDVEAELLEYPNLAWHRAPKPLGSTLLGEPLLDQLARRVARRLAPRRPRIVVNGGNCSLVDVNWVHYVHAAYRRRTSGVMRSARYSVAHARFVANERLAIGRAPVVIANSERTAGDLREYLGIAPARIHIIRYGVDPQLFHPATSDERDTLRARAGLALNRHAVLFVGTLGDDRKGFDVLFRAWARLCDDPRFDADLYVVGRGHEQRRWHALAVAERLDRRIHFFGFRTDVPDLMRAADLLVAPTRYDSYGQNVHEAICCGVPAIVTADAGVAEIYPDSLRDLLLPSAEDAWDLANRIRRWLEQPDRSAVEQFSHELRLRTWDEMCTQMLCAIDARRSSPNDRFAASPITTATAGNKRE